jgi:ABC-2 type transport system ATP-binding protein
MDEPTANLDPESAKTVRDFILELKTQKKTIFLNTHNLDETQRICDKIAILNTRLVAVGTPQELERSIGPRKTVIQLKEVNTGIISALERLGFGKVSQDGNKIAVQLTDPDENNPRVVAAIVGAGGKVQTVSVSSSTLEEVYLKLVREQE